MEQVMNWFHTKLFSINLDNVSEIRWEKPAAIIYSGRIVGGDRGSESDFHYVSGEDIERLKRACGFSGYEAEQAAKAKRAADDIEYANV